jgi:hypothetical protein
MQPVTAMKSISYGDPSFTFHASDTYEFSLILAQSTRQNHFDGRISYDPRSISDLISLVWSLSDPSMRIPTDGTPLSRNTLLSRIFNKRLDELVKPDERPPSFALERWGLDQRAGMHALLQVVLDHLNLTPDNTLQDFYAIHNLIIQGKLQQSQAVEAYQLINSLLIYPFFWLMPTDRQPIPLCGLDSSEAI